MSHVCHRNVQKMSKFLKKIKIAQKRFKSLTYDPSSVPIKFGVSRTIRGATNGPWDQIVRVFNKNGTAWDQIGTHETRPFLDRYEPKIDYRWYIWPRCMSVTNNKSLWPMSHLCHRNVQKMSKFLKKNRNCPEMTWIAYLWSWQYTYKIWALWDHHGRHKWPMKPDC